MMVDAATSDAGGSAHAGNLADPWALSVIDSVVHLAQSSLPTVDSVLGISASMMLNPHLIQQGEDWTGSVSKSLAMTKAKCSAIEDKLEKDPQYHMLMLHLSQIYKASGNHAHGLQVFSHHEYECTEEFQLCFTARVASSIGPTKH